MSINKTIKVEDTRKKENIEPNDSPSIDQNVDPENCDKGNLEPGDYEGRKHKPELDGPQQASQETDDVYDEGREKDSELPPAGKNVGELNAFDLGRHDKD